MTTTTGDDRGSLVEPAGSLIEDASAAPSVSAETEDATRTTAIDASEPSFEPPAGARAVAAS